MASADEQVDGVSDSGAGGSGHDDVEIIDAEVIDAADIDEDAVVAEIIDVVEGDPPVDGGDLSTVVAQRDEYLDALQRVKAEFANFRKRTDAQRAQTVSRAAAGLVAQLLPVLDACDAAMAQGADHVEPIAKVLVESLEKEGLERVGVVDEVFDLSLHEAVLSEDAADGDGDEPVVAEVLRAGYRWKGAILRTAMVKVRG